MAPRAYWKGYLKLSLVSCPIALYPAASSSERVSFNRINKKTGHRLKQQNVDAETGDPVEKDDVVGVEVDLRGGFEAVVGDVDGHTLVAQSFGDPVGVAGHVLDDKDPHLMVAAPCGIAAGRVIWTRSPPAALRHGRLRPASRPTSGRSCGP